jgi:CRISPR-associated protein Csm1
MKKVWLRDGRNPSEFTDELNEAEIADSQRQILDAISYHHAKALKAATEYGRLACNAPAYISYIADNIAAGADRRKEESDEAEIAPSWQPTTPLYSVFNVFGSEANANRGEFRYAPEMLDDRAPIVMPSETGVAFDAHRYTDLVNKLSSVLQDLEPSEQFVSSLLSVLEATLTYVPSSTDASEVRDISLYDHLRLTGAFGSCIYHYLTDSGKDDWASALFENQDQFYAEPAFLLYSFDISGIQDFIYTIHSSGAAKMLRSRSFYLEMLCEHLIDELLGRLELSRANLNYSGGGHGYLILANTEATRAQVGEFEREVNAWLLQNFRTSLFFASGYQAFSAADVMRPKEPSQLKRHAELYSGLYRQISSQISAKKLARYDATVIEELNGRRHQGLRECQVCYRVDDTVATSNGRTLCALCTSLLESSDGILERGFVIVSEDLDGVPLPFGKMLSFASQAQAVEALGRGSRIYAKNKFYAGPEQGVHLWVGDYYESRNFSAYAKGSDGIERMGVVRMDVDSLGAGFVSGFSGIDDGKYNTISRTAQFSRILSLFFRQHINYLLDKPRYRPITSGSTAVSESAVPRKATIIYSGGDDVFVVGAWDDVIEFAVELRDAFIAYTQGKLTLSAGVGLYPDKFPISVMANQTGLLEDAAKGVNGKDAIVLFEPELAFKWDSFRDGVLAEKYNTVVAFLSGSEERGKAFVYKLLELLRDTDYSKPLGGQISLARWVYLLSRLEPGEGPAKAEFRQFSEKLHRWFQDENEARELTMAFYLYAYSTRNTDSSEEK